MTLGSESEFERSSNRHNFLQGVQSQSPFLSNLQEAHGLTSPKRQAEKSLAFVQYIESYNQNQKLKNNRIDDKLKLIRERFQKQQLVNGQSLGADLISSMASSP